jgi:site-specific DNA recombinase
MMNSSMDFLRYSSQDHSRLQNASTIYGNSKRGNGIIRNQIYAGRIVWNKVAMMKDPDTGKRISRPNPPDAWVTTEVPELAIVPVELFEAAQRRTLIQSRPPY